MSEQPRIVFASPEWQLVCEWLREEQDETHARISGMGVDERTSDFLRGKAAFIRTLLNFDNAGNTPA